jgi:hypothetical protein
MIIIPMREAKRIDIIVIIMSLLLLMFLNTNEGCYVAVSCMCASYPTVYLLYIQLNHHNISDLFD